MSLLTSSIDLDMIESPAVDAIPQLNEGDVEELAKLLLLSGDTVRPIILRRISPISFQILEGYFEYFAALKAQEIDDRFASVRAYVVPTELESTILEQYDFLRLLSVPERVTDPIAQNEQTMAKQISSLKSDLQNINAKLDSNSNFDRSSILTIIENLSQRVLAVEDILIEIKQFLIKPDKSEKVLYDFNSLSRDELEPKILSAGVKSKAKSFAQGIYDGRQSKPYNSVWDVKVSGLGKGTMEKIISKW